MTESKEKKMMDWPSKKNNEVTIHRVLFKIIIFIKKNMTKENEWEDVSSAWVKWGKVGDNIFGTFIGEREMKSTLPQQEGVIVRVYDILADGGAYHDTDKTAKESEAIKIEPGTTYSVGGKMSVEKRVGTEKIRMKILAGMDRIKLGQKVKVIFTEEIPPKTKGFNPTKVVRVQTNGQMDNVWLESQNDGSLPSFKE